MADDVDDGYVEEFLRRTRVRGRVAPVDLFMPEELFELAGDEGYWEHTVTRSQYHRERAA